MLNDIVFEGGGAKGLVLVGAINYLEQQGHTFGRVVGTSAGAISATLLAAGYDATELQAAANARLPNGKPVFSAFMDTPKSFREKTIEKSVLYHLFQDIDLPYVPKVVEGHIDKLVMEELLKSDDFREVFSFVELGGVYAGDFFRHWVAEKLNAKKAGLGDMTLAEFAAATGSHLTICASDTTGQELLVLNHRTAPDCPVRWAVRMSMSIPFVWQEVRWNTEWGTYRGRDITGHKVVDGGVLSNFPLELLVSTTPDVLDVMGPPTGNAVLGLLIDETLPVPNAPPAPKTKKGIGTELAHLRVVKRVTRLVDTMTSARDRFVESGFKDDVCHLPAKGYGTTEFDMSDARIKALIDGGYDAMKSFLAKRSIT